MHLKQYFEGEIKALNVAVGMAKEKINELATHF